MPRAVCVVTGSRAEYGLLRWLMQEIRDDSRLRLQVVVTGMHFAARFGTTYREIVADGFEIDAKVDMLLDADDPVSVTKSIGRGVIGFADVFQNLQPDLLVVLGDRFEILAAAQAAVFAQIPIAHIHGGELTEGVIDDSVRHAVTKMSQLHFTAAEPYRRRVIQMGEDPARVFNVGALGVENVKRTEPLSRKDFESAIGMPLGDFPLLVTFHPETLDRDRDGSIVALLAALDQFLEGRIIFTSPNADSGGQAIADAIDRYVGVRSERATLCRSLGHTHYVTALAHVRAVIGNSSSGIIEAPAAGVPTVNIGDRQKGRLRSASIIDCEAKTPAIAEAIRRALSPEFQRIAKATVPTYGVGDAARRIHEILATAPLGQLARKAFHDVA